MLLVVTKEVAIGDSVVKLYSIDSGKTWISRPADLQLFKHRRRENQRILQRMIALHVLNDSFDPE
jgi:hypothetical protein